MRSFAFIVLALAHVSASQPAPPPSGHPTNVYIVTAHPLRLEAPADEYFGHNQLSTLSVRNGIEAMTIEGNSPLALPLQTERIAAVQSAMGAWAQRYPYDPWLPSAMAKFASFLIGKQRPEYDRAALGWLGYLQLNYPNSWYAHFADDKIAALAVHPQNDLLLGPMSIALEDVNATLLHQVGVRGHR